MIIHSSIRNLLARGGVYLNENNGEGNDLGGSEADKAAAAAAEAQKTADAEAAAAAEAEARKKASGDDTKRQPTDEEAKLLKEVMKRKENERTLQADLEKAKETLKQFEGIDAEAVRKLLAEQKKAEEQQLEAKGEWDRLKGRMAEEHTKETGSLRERIAELESALGVKDGLINEMTIGAGFNSSKLIADELTLPVSKARALYGSHFELKDGKVVGYDKPKGAENRTALVDARGEALDFDGALRKIVEADPDAKSLLKSGVRQGSGSSTTPPAAARRNVDAGKEKSGQDMIASGLGALLGQK